MDERCVGCMCLNCAHTKCVEHCLRILLTSKKKCPFKEVPCESYKERKEG